MSCAMAIAGYKGVFSGEVTDITSNNEVLTFHFGPVGLMREKYDFYPGLITHREVDHVTFSPASL